MKIFRKRVEAIIVIIFLCASALLVAAVDPAWYDITFTSNPYINIGDLDFVLNSSNVNLGNFVITRAENYETSATWLASDQTWGDEESNLTFVYTPLIDPASQHAILKNTKPQQSHKILNMSYVIDAGLTSYTHIAVIEETMESSLERNIAINVLIPPGENPKSLKGSYTSFLTLQIYAEYGTNNQVLISEFNYFTLGTYDREDSGDGLIPPPPDQIVTSLVVNRYANAQNVDVLHLQQNGTYFLVGSVTFSSNDSTQIDGKYSLKISPKGNPLGLFTFYHKANSSSFVYKVHVRGRSTATDKQFSILVPTPASGLMWSDFIEIAVSGVYTPHIPPGEYESTIVIELVNN